MLTIDSKRWLASRALLSIMVLTLLAAGCGGDSYSDDSSGGAAPPPESTDGDTAGDTPDDAVDTPDAPAGVAAAIVVVPDSVALTGLTLRQCSGEVPLPAFSISVENTGVDEATFDVIARQDTDELGRQDGIVLAAGASDDLTIEVSLRSFDPIVVEALGTGSTEVAGSTSVEVVDDGPCAV